MDASTKAVVWGQYGAAIEMLENAIVACPEEVWSDRSRTPEFWYVAYHTTFWLDYYLVKDEKSFTPPPPFGLEEMDPAGVLPPRVYSKAEVLTYLELGSSRCRAWIESLTPEQSAKPCGFERRDLTVAELCFYTLRHVQHHAAQLNLMLRQAGHEPPRWVSRARTAVR